MLTLARFPALVNLSPVGGRMKIVFRVASLVMCGLSLNGQITAVLTKFAGRSQVDIRNNSTADLTAFAISISPAYNSSALAPFVFYFDAAVDADGFETYEQPILPNQKFAVPVMFSILTGHPIDLYGPPIVSAAVFADGNTTGDETLLSRLKARKGYMLQTVDLAREILAGAGSRNVPRNQLVEQFRLLANSVNRWYLPLEAQVGRPLYQSIAEKLMTLPELQLGSPFPPTAFVEQEMAMLNRERTALLESKPRLADTAGIIPRR
jgi:hypothetical protein